MTNETQTKSPSRRIPLQIYDLLLIVVLLFGAYLRGNGLDWGEYQYLHPDERFLVWVGTDISPVKYVEGPDGAQKQWISLGEYFDTPNSPLNPNNKGHGFYVYGTLPMFISRYLVEGIFGHSGFDVMTDVGRALSALSDLLTVLLVYLIAARVYDKRVGLLAAAFSAAAVLQIQQSHFFTMDTFSNAFAFLAFYFAVRIMTDKRSWAEPGTGSGDSVVTNHTDSPASWQSRVKAVFRHPLLWPSLMFGVAYGAAMASKLSIYPLALVLPAAILIRIMEGEDTGKESPIWSPQWQAKFRTMLIQALPYLAVAGLASLIIFRIAQPYAFSGPGLLGIKPNPAWVAQIREQRNQATPEVDFPPAMQWARRPVWFSGQNLTIWGLGLPLGLLAWAGFLWAGWEILRGKWRRHALLWGWTAFYFIWQSLALNPTMRYQLPIYPSLAIFAAWGIIHLWDVGKERRQCKAGGFPAQQTLAAIFGSLALVATFAYAFGFTQIYSQPITRVEASRWIYQNIPGPINLKLETDEGTYNQPLPFPYNGSILAGSPYRLNFVARASGELSTVTLHKVRDLQRMDEPSFLQVSIEKADGTLLGQTALNTNFEAAAQAGQTEHQMVFEKPVRLEQDQAYVLKFELPGNPPTALLNSQTSFRFMNENGKLVDNLVFPFLAPDWKGASGTALFNPDLNGVLSEIYLPAMEQSVQTDKPINLVVSIQVEGQDINPIPETIIGEAVTQDDPRGPGYRFRLQNPKYLLSGERASISLSILDKQTALEFSGAGLANEGEWDDGLPLRVDGYDGYGGIYPLDLNFNMYWDDNAAKLDRFLRILDQSEYIVITSNRQWGSLPRIPERFPMTTVYYRNLLGCPPDQDIVWCYRVAEPEMFEGELGFELVKTFTSSPQIGNWKINDQFAEEAFTVYDHPKVLVFKKTADYNHQKVSEILGSVDLNKVVRLAPLKFASHPADLMLPLERWVKQVSGGTWSELFNTSAIQNRSQVVGGLIWYLSLALLGLAVFPLLRMALPGLPDRGYPLARISGLLILSYLTWLAGSAEVPFTRPIISLVLLVILGVGVWLAIRQREELRQEWPEQKRYFLMVELVFLAFFVLDLLIRLGNPDLWHPWKGGEKPMDFAYFNAVLKSTTFPPYDPWFAGGYLNYYYYGFVLVGALVKWLGIAPAVAYNLVLPTLFACIAIGAFSASWNLYQASKQVIPLSIKAGTTFLKPFWVGLAGALGMALLGNLGTVKMIYQGYQRLAAPGGVIENSSLFTRLGWAVQGFFKNMAGTPLPYGIGDWYWNPSRAIPSPGEVEPITEFPFFTVLYADLHAHLFSLALALLALAFAISVVLARGRWAGKLEAVSGFLLGALALGALRPTNTWDYYPYLALATIALGYAVWRYYQPASKNARLGQIFGDLAPQMQRILVSVGSMALLVILSSVLYRPFSQWYGLGYSKIDFWQGLRTPISAYLTHWGLFLFMIASWLAWETRDWMASTPLSTLKKLRPYRGWIVGSVVFLALLTISLVIKLPQSTKNLFGNGVFTAIISLPMAAWAGALLLRKEQTDAKRFTLFLIGTGLVLTLMVEVIVLVGDIGRMNTVFKFYLQVWTFLAISAAVALGWLLSSLPDWAPGWRNSWGIAFVLLLTSAALYPITATRAKIADRMTPDAPHTLDGMKYMQSSQYDWLGLMDLSQDYNAIRWMQENVQDSPVIVEANLRDLYRWGSRIGIYTGLPGVVGWEWHQQQQRALTPGSWVSERIAEVDQFYNTTNLRSASAFLRKYGVKYIVVGQLERNIYPGAGLDKFEAQNGLLWQEVFRDRHTVIYEVLPETLYME